MEDLVEVEEVLVLVVLAVQVDLVAAVAEQEWVIRDLLQLIKQLVRAVLVDH
jgi:hypothetical protein